MAASPAPTRKKPAPAPAPAKEARPGLTTVLTDPRIDPDRLMLAQVDTSAGPHFTVSEMANFFFGKSNHWVRWLEGIAEIGEDGKKKKDAKGVPFWFTDPQTGERRKVGQGRNDKSARVYTLTDVEEVAHALAQNGRISGTQLRQTLLLVQVSAEMRDFL